MAIVISFVSQKGGVGKSTGARGTAIEFEKNGWDVHIGDLDTTQFTTFKWSERRDAIEITPSISVSSYKNAKGIKAHVDSHDLVVIDGTPYATSETIEIAKISDLIVIPTGVTVDDLEPQLNLGQELVIKAKVKKEQILFIITKVPEGGEKEANSTYKSITDWGFECVPTYLPFKVSYGQAMDSGYGMTETRFQTLNEKAGEIVEYISAKAIALKNVNKEVENEDQMELEIVENG